MKRIICFLLALLMTLSLFGCKKNDSASTLQFYYPRSNYGYYPQEERFSERAIEAEIRKDVPYHSSILILSEYLKGPSDPTLVSPFPAGLSLTDVSIDSGTVYLTLTNQLAELEGIPLLIACACLSKTAMAITQTSSAHIKCQDALLDGNEAIILDDASLILDDPAITEPIE